MYQVKKAFASIKGLTTRVNGKSVGLNTEIYIDAKPSKAGPGNPIVIPKATQADLQALFHQGNPTIELVDGGDEEKAPAKNKKLKPADDAGEIETLGNGE